MMKIMNGVAVFVIGEVVALVVFMIIRKSVGGASIFRRPDIETLKGILERLVLFLGLIGGYSTVLVMFGALKLGTRLHDETNKTISNNYFLIGNLFSALIAIVDALVSRFFLKGGCA